MKKQPIVAEMKSRVGCGNRKYIDKLMSPVRGKKL